MKNIRRWLILPVLMILIAAALLLMGKIQIDTDLPLHIIAPIAAAAAGFILLVLLGAEARSVSNGWVLPDPEEPPTTDKIIRPQPLSDAADAIDMASKFSKKATDRVKIEIDIEDARDDE